jgi:hypothetical protein
MKSNIFKMSFAAISLSCITVFIISISSTNAQDRGFENAGLCDRVGTWYGTGDQGNTWITIYSPGSNATKGQLTSEWIEMDATLGIFNDVVRLTDAQGVWEKIDQHTYRIFWIAYGLNAANEIVYTGRASGTMVLDGCDHVTGDYVLEISIDESHPLYNSFRDGIICGNGISVEDRMTLDEVICLLSE